MERVQGRSEEGGKGEKGGMMTNVTKKDRGGWGLGLGQEGRKM